MEDSTKKVLTAVGVGVGATAAIATAMYFLGGREAPKVPTLDELGGFAKREIGFGALLDDNDRQTLLQRDDNGDLVPIGERFVRPVSNEAWRDAVIESARAAGARADRLFNYVIVQSARPDGHMLDSIRWYNNQDRTRYMFSTPSFGEDLFEVDVYLKS